MNVLVLSNLYPPNAIGGYERLTAAVAAGLERRGHRISVLTSDYGPAVAAEEGVERSLKLLVSDRSIYRPYEGTPSERDARNRLNAAVLERKLAAERPDAVLVGNLFFLDRSLLDALRPVASRTVYLLTDVWRINFEDEDALQAWFRRNVFERRAGVAPLVPPDPPGLFLERISTLEAWEARAKDLALERARRDRLEDELGRGRATFQLPGWCHLCGPTSFLVRRPGPSTLTLGARGALDATCARCGLGMAARSVLHALDLLAAPGEPEEILLAARDGETRRTLAQRFPRCTVAAEIPNGSRYRHAAALEVLSEGDLSALAAAVTPGGAVVAAAPPEPWDLLARARSAGVREAAIHACWSPEYGYLGGERLVIAGRAT